MITLAGSLTANTKNTFYTHPVMGGCQNNFTIGSLPDPHCLHLGWLHPAETSEVVTEGVMHWSNNYNPVLLLQVKYAGAPQGPAHAIIVIHACTHLCMELVILTEHQGLFLVESEVHIQLWQLPYL